MKIYQFKIRIEFQFSIAKYLEYLIILRNTLMVQSFTQKGMLKVLFLCPQIVPIYTSDIQ